MMHTPLTCSPQYLVHLAFLLSVIPFTKSPDATFLAESDP